jgi:hypothetical protein
VLSTGLIGGVWRVNSAALASLVDLLLGDLLIFIVYVQVCSQLVGPLDGEVTSRWDFTVWGELLKTRLA